MIKRISRSDELMKKLMSEGKVHSTTTATDNAAMEQMNERLRKFRKEYKIKEAESRLSASKVILNS